MEQRVIELFHESIEAKMQAGEYLAPLLCEASEMMVHSLLNGGKIITAGNGVSNAKSQILSANLCNRFERERPSLPAIALGTDVTALTAITNDYSFSEIFAKQIRALGQPGDCLVLISASGKPNNLIQAAAAAHERDMSVITLLGNKGGHIASVLEANDLEIRVPVESVTRVHEIHLLSIFCICDLIDQQLFGLEE
ncbi:MAG: SIS domain-containing protein [Gammaproteobacteria bacterium]|uniref:SIS domain-containing protein n=1 Tax=Pseudomaricurvus alcaniphilus TaxID=1166482 RepID=UPI001409F3E3|nr:SIS domain-containing protein [Pseudomaricurvus alcaniphilus]MBR9909089.1 SIS domain-containing protein [Gammaproteobacteria bacterium]NHN38134.1 SIS domain-containing protein [Pseudomaricurvus alcaniphilus]